MARSAGARRTGFPVDHARVAHCRCHHGADVGAGFEPADPARAPSATGHHMPHGRCPSAASRAPRSGALDLYMGHIPIAHRNTDTKESPRSF